MSDASWSDVHSALVDTGVFIYWLRGDQTARRFFRDPRRTVYYSKVTRKELLKEPIRAAEAQRVKAFLSRFRPINPDAQIAGRFSELLQQYPALQRHLADALIAATAWEKNLPLITTNPRHFVAIEEISTIRFLSSREQSQ